MRANERLRVLTTVMRSFAEATTDLDHLLTVIARNAAEVLGDACVVLMLDAQGDKLAPIAAHAVDEDALRRAERLVESDPFTLETHPTARMVLESKGAFLVPVINPSALQVETTSAYAAYQREQGIHSLLAVALHAHGKSLGLITLTRYRPTSPPFDEDDKELALNLADHASLAIVNARLYDAEREARLTAEEAVVSQRATEATLEQVRALVEARKLAEQQLVEAKEATEHANRELEAFSYSVAHDLRSPLRGMNGFARILLEEHGDKLDADGRSLLEKIAVNATKMGHLIDGLLDLARLNRTQLSREEVNLSAMVRTTLTDLARPETELVIPEGLIVDADPALLQPLIDNLAGNAVKFTARVEHPRIELGHMKSEGEDTYFLRDNGAGFDMRFADLLFKPFQRLHNVKDFAGTGIGLATVQRIVARHGGRIWAEGKVGAGATIYFTLPQ